MRIESTFGYNFIGACHIVPFSVDIPIFILLPLRNKMKNHRIQILFRSMLMALIIVSYAAAQNISGKNIVSISNTTGIKMITIVPGSFTMGSGRSGFNLDKKTDFSKDAPYYDEAPVHQVNITYPFSMSETEITIEQYRLFKKNYKGGNAFHPYVSGISWNDANEFCEWLSKKEGKPYRLPTEAEWEYACRAGTTGLFWSGDQSPKADTNPWGFKNMASGVAEWCYDWYGPYTANTQTDPVGYKKSWTKVVRGGPANTTEMNEHTLAFQRVSEFAFYRSSNRASLQPDCPAAGSENVKSHFIGFRIVQGPLPKTTATDYLSGFPMQGNSKHKFCVSRSQYGTTLF